MVDSLQQITFFIPKWVVITREYCTTPSWIRCLYLEPTPVGWYSHSWISPTQSHKTVTSIQHLTYEKRCKAFNITKLDLRRTRGDFLQMYKLSTKLDTIEWHSEQIAREPRGGHRGLLVREVGHFSNECNVSPMVWNVDNAFFQHSRSLLPAKLKSEVKK